MILALALARQGLFTALRAFGHDLSTAPQVTANLASLRLARLRLAAIAFSALGAVFARRFALPPETAVTAALALSLALTGPALALALWPRAGNAAAAVALIVGAANFARLGAVPQSLSEISLALAGQGALAALLAGGFVALVFPARRVQGDAGDLAFFE